MGLPGAPSAARRARRAKEAAKRVLGRPQHLRKCCGLPFDCPMPLIHLSTELHMLDLCITSEMEGGTVQGWK